MNWTEDYRLVIENDLIQLIHVPSGKVLLSTPSVSMESLNGLIREFYTFGTVRDNWREWWDERD